MTPSMRTGCTLKTFLISLRTQKKPVKLSSPKSVTRVFRIRLQPITNSTDTRFRGHKKPARNKRKKSKGLFGVKILWQLISMVCHQVALVMLVKENKDKFSRVVRETFYKKIYLNKQEDQRNKASAQMN